MRSVISVLFWRGGGGVSTFAFKKLTLLTHHRRGVYHHVMDVLRGVDVDVHGLTQERSCVHKPFGHLYHSATAHYESKRLDWLMRSRDGCSVDRSPRPHTASNSNRWTSQFETEDSGEYQIRSPKHLNVFRINHHYQGFRTSNY